MAQLDLCGCHEFQTPHIKWHTLIKQGGEVKPRGDGCHWFNTDKVKINNVVNANKFNVTE